MGIFSKSSEWPWVLCARAGDSYFCQADIDPAKPPPATFRGKRMTRWKMGPDPIHDTRAKAIQKDATDKLHTAIQSRMRSEHELKCLQTKLQADVDQQIAALGDPPPPVKHFAAEGMMSDKTEFWQVGGGYTMALATEDEVAGIEEFWRGYAEELVRRMDAKLRGGK